MTGENSNHEAGELNAILLQLKEERAKLRSLQELHSLKLTNKSNRQELDSLVAQVQQVQGETIRLTLKVEDLTGQVIDLESQIDGKGKNSNNGNKPGWGNSV